MPERRVGSEEISVEGGVFGSASKIFLEKKVRGAQEPRTPMGVRSINCKRDQNIRARVHKLWNGG